MVSWRIQLAYFEYHHRVVRLLFSASISVRKRSAGRGGSMSAAAFKGPMASAIGGNTGWSGRHPLNQISTYEPCTVLSPEHAITIFSGASSDQLLRFHLCSPYSMKKCKIPKPRTPKKIVRLIAYSDQGQQVLDELVPFQEYFEKTHPLVDDVQFRKHHRIVRACGTIYTKAGILLEEFTIGFDQAGSVIGEASRLADGTLIGEWEELRESFPLQQIQPSMENLTPMAKHY